MNWFFKEERSSKACGVGLSLCQLGDALADPESSGSSNTKGRNTRMNFPTVCGLIILRSVNSTLNAGTRAFPLGFRAPVLQVTGQLASRAFLLNSEKRTVAFCLSLACEFSNSSTSGRTFPYHPTGTCSPKSSVRHSPFLASVFLLL